MDAVENTLYKHLDEERRDIADAFISFLYQQQSESTAEDETAEVIQAALNGEGIIGPYSTIDELMEALDA